MKKTILFLFVIGLCADIYAQRLPELPKALTERSRTRSRIQKDEPVNPQPYMQEPARGALGFAEDLLGSTVYDLQSNRSSPFGRLVRFDDGTFGAVWTRGMNPTAYSDRGTGYNYFNGSAWAAEPSARIESVRTGWPSIAQMGANGEAVVSHRNATSPLRFMKRSSKGSGAWSESEIPGPSGASGIEWPRMVSGGQGKNTLHILALTGPTSTGGTVYNGQDGALVYTKSPDNGSIWTTPVVLPGLGSSNYLSFNGDVYEFAEPKDNHLAFVICDNACDLILMRSSDNGTTWRKTILWEHPYPFFNPATTPSDTIYTPDQSVALAFDRNGKLHVAFGVYRVRFIGDNTYTYWPGLSGIAYWNEDMTVFTGGDQKNILNPDSLDAQGKLIGYYNIDWDGDGVLNYLDGDDFYGDYGLAWASMPQIAFDENNNAILIYSSITENFDNGTQNYRHIWCRASSNNAASWGPVIDLIDDPAHMFDECIFPSISAGSDASSWYFTYMIDNEPGLAIQGDEDPPSDNYNNFYHLSKILNGTGDAVVSQQTLVSANYPNPFSGATSIDITLARTSPVTLSLSAVTGQTIKYFNYGTMQAGVHTLSPETSDLGSGVYFYTINIGQQKVTRKMVVR